MRKKKEKIVVHLGDLKELVFSDQANKVDEEEIKWFSVGMLLHKELTQKQFEVFYLKIAMNKAEEDIATILGISRRSVRDRWELVCRKGEKIFQQYEFIYSNELIKKLEAHVKSLRTDIQRQYEEKNKSKSIMDIGKGQ